MSHIRGNGAPHQPQKFKAEGPPRAGFGEWAGSGPIDSRGVKSFRSVLDGGQVARSRRLQKGGRESSLADSNPNPGLDEGS
jgi:hypothetical protein